MSTKKYPAPSGVHGGWGSGPPAGINSRNEIELSSYGTNASQHTMV
jgi:hypothetical protein